MPIEPKKLQIFNFVLKEIGNVSFLRNLNNALASSTNILIKKFHWFEENWINKEKKFYSGTDYIERIHCINFGNTFANPSFAYRKRKRKLIDGKDGIIFFQGLFKYSLVGCN